MTSSKARNQLVRALSGFGWGTSTSSCEIDPVHVRRLWLFVLVLGAIAMVCLAVGHVYVSGDGMMSAAFAAALVAHVSSRISLAEVLTTVGLAMAFLLARPEAFALGGVEPHFDRIVSALGLASVAVQVARLVRLRGAEWTSSRAGFATLTLLTPMFSLTFASSIGLPGLVRHDLYDAYVLHFDRAIFGGMLPSAELGRWLGAHSGIASVAGFAYWAPQALNMFVYIAERRSRSSRDLLKTLFIAGFAGYAFFPLFPVVGPGYVLPAFPHIATTAASISDNVPVTVPRNCMPSLHMADALIIAVHAAGLGRVAWWILGAVDVALTVVATLGFGYHYAADLIAAVPFSYAVLGVARGDRRAAILGAGVLAALLLLIRWTN
jgi:hypothetical protein